MPNTTWKDCYHCSKVRIVRNSYLPSQAWSSVLMLEVLIGPPDTWSLEEDSVRDIKIACLEIDQECKVSPCLCRDALLALHMTQREINARNKIVLAWVARLASQLRSSLLGNLHQELLGKMTSFLSGGSRNRLKISPKKEIHQGKWLPPEEKFLSDCEFLWDSLGHVSKVLCKGIKWEIKALMVRKRGL